MATLLGDHNVRGISNVDLRVNNGIDKITLNSNVTSVTLTNRSTRVCAVEATVSSDANPATIVLPTVSTLPSGKEWSWTGLFFDSTVPVRIVSESSVLLFTAFPNDVVEVMWVSNENNWKIVSHLKDEKKERLTGMLYPVGTDTVELTVDASTNKQYLVISDRVLFFNYGDGTTKRVFFKEAVVEIPATSSGNTEPTYVSINDAGTVLFDNTPITMATRDRALVARGIRVKISNIWNLTNFKYMPYLADTDSLLRSAALVEHKFCVFPKTGTTNSRVRFTDFELVQEGINYENSILNPDRLHVAAADPGVFYTFYPNTMSLTSSSEVDGNVYYNTSTSSTASVPAAKFTIQVLLSSPKGEIWRLYGQELFDSIEAASEASLGSTWDVTGLPTDGVAVAAYAIKGDQYSGSSALDLTSRTNFTICAIPQQLLSEGSAGGASAPMVSGNTVLQENVVVGEAAAIKNFNFKSHVPVTVSGDTVTVSVNGVTNSNASNVASPVIHTWTGTQDEYDELESYNADTIYNIIDSDYSFSNQYHEPLLSFRWTDHILNDIRWLRADTFSWQSGDIYKSVYDHLVSDLQSMKRNGYCWLDENNIGGNYTLSSTPAVGDIIYTEEVTFTSVGINVCVYMDEVGSVSGSTITGLFGTYTRDSSNDINNLVIDRQYSTPEEYAFVAADGHKIKIEDPEVGFYGVEGAQNVYNETGVAWYFIIDLTNHRFKLPRTKWGFTGLRNNVGDYVPQDVLLPNITGEFYATSDWQVSSATYSGAFVAGPNRTRNDPDTAASHSYPSLTFDASRSSNVYSGNGSNTYVRQRSTQMYLYFFVGHFATAAIEQTAGLNAEDFNSKVDLNAANLSSAGKSLIAGLGLPSTSYTDLTLGASGTTYTAPANGYFVFVGNTSVNMGAIIMADPDSGFYAPISRAQTSAPLGTIFPVLKGRQMAIAYDGISSVIIFRFYYAEGSKQEA